MELALIQRRRPTRPGRALVFRQQHWAWLLPPVLQALGDQPDLAQQAVAQAHHHAPAEALAGGRRPGQSRRLDHDDRAQPGHRPRAACAPVHREGPGRLRAMRRSTLRRVRVRCSRPRRRRWHPIPDDQLRLIFTCCHPALASEAAVALTLRTLGGLTTPEIAHAFLVPESTLAQRLVRAKKKICEAGIAYEVPSGERLADRLDAVLQVLYLVFNGTTHHHRDGRAWIAGIVLDQAHRGRRNWHDRPPHDALEYRFLARKVEIDRALAEAGTRRDVLDPRRRKPVFEEKVERRIEHFVGPSFGTPPEFGSPLHDFRAH